MLVIAAAVLFAVAQAPLIMRYEAREEETVDNDF